MGVGNLNRWASARRQRPPRRATHDAVALFAALAVCSAALSMSGCGVIDVQAVSCSVGGEYPHQSSGSPGYIVSKGRVFCNGRGSVQSVTATIKVQELAFRTWRDVAGTIDTQTKLQPKLSTAYTIQNRPLLCHRGTFRTAVRVDFHLNGEDIKVLGGGWGYSKSVSNPCG